MRVNRSSCFLARNLFAAASALMPYFAYAQVESIGDVQPADNPFSLFINEGLITDGADVDFGTFANPPTVDTDGDGIPDSFTDASGANPGQEFYEQNRNVVVGASRRGELNIFGGASLRNTHLVIGGAVDPDPTVVDELVNVGPTDAAITAGTSGFGIVRISGSGTEFNNHPLVVPTIFQSAADPEEPAFAIPVAHAEVDLNFDGDFDDFGESFEAGSIQRADDGNYDAYIGLTGQGQLEISSGGSAEIQDAVIIGFGTQAVGLVTVTGSGSTLRNYGNLSPVTGIPGGESVLSQMIVGAYGSGTLRIEDGGTVQALRGAAIGVTGSDGAQVDEFPEVGDGGGDVTGGNGLVVVSGAGSNWEITLADFAAGGDGPDDSALAIGEFVLEEGEETLEPVYQTTAGQGSLRIEDGGVVRVLDGGGVGAAAAERDEADLRIGRLGDVTLADGSLEVRGDIFSDGQIEGDGEILTGTFVNRARGVVSVNAGESLTIRSNAEEVSPDLDDLDTDSADDLLRGVFDAATPAGGPPPIPTIAQPTGAFGINVGRIEVIGDENGIAEFTFERSNDGTLVGAVEQRFWNARRTAPAGGPPALNQAGEIIVNNGHLHFRTGTDLTGVNDGIRNDGEIAFVGGDNLVTGTVETTDLGTINVTAAGAVTFGADGTFVTFADGAINNGMFVVDGADVLVLPGSDAYAGTGTLALIGDATFSAQGTFRLEAGAELAFTTVNGVTPNLSVSGEFLIDGLTTLTIAGDFGATASVGDVLTLITVTPGSTNDLLTDNFNLLQFGDDLPAFTDPDLALLFEPGGNSLTFEVISLSSLGPIDAGDFNGDGMLDQTDVDIFGLFFGVQNGASVINGDLDGDGAVTAADFFLLQELIPGATLPVSSFAAVPEPAAVGLVLLGCAGFVSRRRR